MNAAGTSCIIFSGLPPHKVISSSISRSLNFQLILNLSVTNLNFDIFYRRNWKSIDRKSREKSKKTLVNLDRIKIKNEWIELSVCDVRPDNFSISLINQIVMQYYSGQTEIKKDFYMLQLNIAAARVSTIVYKLNIDFIHHSPSAH